MNSRNNQNAAMLGDIVKTCDMGKTSIKQLMPYIKTANSKSLLRSSTRIITRSGMRRYARLPHRESRSRERRGFQS